MNSKGQYTQQSNTGLMIILILALFVVIGGSIYILQSKGKIPPIQSFMPIYKPVFVEPPINANFCIAQKIVPGVDLRTPITQEIKGWDKLSDCCVRDYVGYSDCLGKEITLSICYRAEIGGELMYAKVNGYNLKDISQYSNVIKDLHKTYTGSKEICSLINYP